MPASRRSTAIATLALLAAGFHSGAQAVPGADAVSRPETISGVGNWPIRMTYYPAKDKLPGNDKVDVRNAPVAILLHGANGSRLFWDKNSAWPGQGQPGPFAEVLQANGFAVLTVDLRKHGESTREGDTKISSSDYSLMVDDLFNVKQFIYEQHQQERLNMRKCAIVALDDSCPVAAAFAELDWKLPPHDDHAVPAERTPRGGDMRALVLISPTASVGQLRATNSLRYLANPDMGIAFMLVAGKKDSEGNKTAKTLHRIVGTKANESRTRLEEPDTNERSEHLFGSQRLRTEAGLLAFLKKNVLELPIPWQDRRSRRDR